MLVYSAAFGAVFRYIFLCEAWQCTGNVLSFAVTKKSKEIFRDSSAVEQWTVNPLVVGSNPTPGAFLLC